MPTATMERPKVPARREQPLYTLWPRQQEAMELLGLTSTWYEAQEPVEELLYGGQAGGGKSFLLRAVGAALCLIWPGAVVPVFRRTYPELEETHIRRVHEEISPEVAHYNNDRHELRFPNGSVLEFRYCERDDDVFRYQSAEWDGLLIDEATHFTGFQIDYLRSRVRSTRPLWRPIIVYGSNPGNKGHLYFKNGFVDAAPAGERFLAPREDGGLRRCFLRAELEDNPSLGLDYRRMLDGIKDATLRRALAEGDWDVFGGQYFSAWRRNKHVCEPFPIPPTWTNRRISVDFGSGAPFCALFAVRDEDAWSKDRVARWYIYRELYQAGLRDVEQARQIAGMMQADYGEQRTFAFQCVADPSMWNRQPNGMSIATAYTTAGVPITKANNDRIPGWQRVKDYLADQSDGKSGLVFFSTCLNSIRTIPSLVHDKTKVEDVDSDGEDHAADALRYLIMSLAPLERRVEQPASVPYLMGQASHASVQDDFIRDAFRPRVTVIRRGG